MIKKIYLKRHWMTGLNIGIAMVINLPVILHPVAQRRGGTAVEDADRGAVDRLRRGRLASDTEGLGRGQWTERRPGLEQP